MLLRLLTPLAMVLFSACAPNVALACRLALVLAIDVSRSIDSSEYSLQFLGLASAFQDKDVRAAILNQAEPVSVMAFEWGGRTHQQPVSDWSLLTTTDDIDRFANRLAHHQRRITAQNTAIGPALIFAHKLLAGGPDCQRRVIDISGDGYNNAGPTPARVYETLDFSEVIVNALVVTGHARPALQRYFETDVIHGPGAFTIGTHNFKDYATAIRKKLLRELTPDPLFAAVNAD